MIILFDLNMLKLESQNISKYFSPDYVIPSPGFRSIQNGWFSCQNWNTRICVLIKAGL